MRAFRAGSSVLAGDGVANGVEGFVGKMTQDIGKAFQLVGMQQQGFRYVDAYCASGGHGGGFHLRQAGEIAGRGLDDVIAQPAAGGIEGVAFPLS